MAATTYLKGTKKEKQQIYLEVVARRKRLNEVREHIKNNPRPYELYWNLADNLELWNNDKEIVVFDWKMEQRDLITYLELEDYRNTLFLMELGEL